MARWTQTKGERFWAKVRKSDDCWEWVGAHTRKGYGVFYWEGRQIGATRAALLLHDRGDEGPFVLHTCDNVRCVRPDHLYGGDAAQNTADMIARGRAGWLTHPDKFRELAANMRAKHQAMRKEART